MLTLTTHTHTHTHTHTPTRLPHFDTANHPDCNTYATLGREFNNEAGKNITCPYLLNTSVAEGSNPPTSLTGSCAHQLGSLPPNGSVEWCYYTPAKGVVDIGPATLCINATGHRTVSYSKTVPAPELRIHMESITVLDDGRLSFPEVNYYFTNATINCTVFAEDGRLCNEDAASITLLKRSKH